MVLYVCPLSMINAVYQTILQLLTRADDYVSAIFCQNNPAIPERPPDYTTSIIPTQKMYLNKKRLKNENIILMKL